MKKILLFVVVALFVNQSKAQWLSNGPYGNGGYISCLVSNDSTVFAGTGNGLYLSVDQGANWILKDSGLNVNGDKVISLALKDSIILAGTNTFGFYLSIDKANHWKQVNNGINQLYPTPCSIALEGDNFFAASNGSIFFTSNNGSNWNRKDNGIDTTLGDCFQLAVSSYGIFAGSFNHGMFLSANNGTSWDTSGLKGHYIYSIIVKDSNIYAGTDNGIYLYNKSNNWSWVGLSSTPVKAIAVNGSYIFAGSDGGGISLSKDNGQNWSKINSGLIDLHITSLLINGSNIFAGSQSSGIWQRPLVEIINEVENLQTTRTSFKFYPNPASTDITVEQGSNEESTFCILDMNGTEVLRQSLQGRNTDIDIHNLVEGIYCVSVVSNLHIENKKLIIVK